MVELQPQPPIAYKMFKRDGTPIWAQLNSAPLLDSHGRLKGVITVCENITELRRLNETLEQRVAERTAEAVDRACQLRMLAVELTQAEQEQRRQLAKILHDELQQLLVAARMKLGMLRRGASNDQQRSAVGAVDELLLQAINESRSLTAELSSPVLYEQGLAAALQWLGGHMQEKFALAVEVEADPAADPADDATRTTLFQAVRELVFNDVKHAHASHVWVKMTPAAPKHVRIEVRDNGVGFNPTEVQYRDPSKGGFGLFSIRERLAALGGQTEITATPGQGTTIVAIAPRTQT
jgi:signal transduction histidine kinase